MTSKGDMNPPRPATSPRRWRPTVVVPSTPPVAALRDAALELLAEIGYDRLTIDSVAARAHASKATIYRRWPGKAELVVDALTSLKGVAAGA